LPNFLKSLVTMNSLILIFNVICHLTSPKLEQQPPLKFNLYNPPEIVKIPSVELPDIKSLETLELNNDKKFRRFWKKKKD